FVCLSRVFGALGVIGLGKVYKPMGAYRCSGDPGFPRPTADRREGAQGNRDDPPQENLQKPWNGKRFYKIYRMFCPVMY
ncbi:MAG: hypothetical protein QXV28_08105, partial [Ignisphaera sp.]